MSNRKAIFSLRPFEKLRKALEQQAGVAPPPPPRRKKKEEYTDEELFRREMHDVREIEAFRALPSAQHRRKPIAAVDRRDPDGAALTVLAEIAAGQRPMHLPDMQEYVEWVSPEYHDTIIPELHAGRFSVQAFLDLHGCTVVEAEEELSLFLDGSFKKGLHCVKIIHGRGLRSVKGPQIKASVVKRLAGHYRKDLIAFVTARQCDGGLGALYVLLKKK
jgi:DNA-nicking Smr family endonuclease